MTTDELSEVTALDKDAMNADEGIPGERIDSLYLVCTHGRHDRCCSVRGNPVARALCAEYGEAAWECSHIGGDRFAANVVCLPKGAYFGRVPATGANSLIEDYRRGVLDLDRFRGWSALPFAVQAAEIETRRNLRLDKIEDITTDSWRKTKDTEVEVHMTTEGYGPLKVTVTLGRHDDAYYLTCKAEQPARPPLFVTSS